MGTQEHRYESCRDRNCERPYCRIWREAFAEGYDEGAAAAYGAGFEDGVNACPRSHEG